MGMQILVFSLAYQVLYPLNHLLTPVKTCCIYVELRLVCGVGQSLPL